MPVTCCGSAATGLWGLDQERRQKRKKTSNKESPSPLCMRSSCSSALGQREEAPPGILSVPLGPLPGFGMCSLRGFQGDTRKHGLSSSLSAALLFSGPLDSFPKHSVQGLSLQSMEEEGWSVFSPTFLEPVPLTCFFFPYLIRLLKILNYRCESPLQLTSHFQYTALS